MAQDLDNTNPQSRVRLIPQPELEQRLRVQQQELPASNQSPEPDSQSSSAAYRTQVLATMTALMGTIGSLLAARMILLLSMLGAVLLAYLAMTNPDQIRLLVCVTYDVCVLGPLVLLYLRKG